MRAILVAAILFCVTFNKRAGAQTTSCGALYFYGASGTITSPNYPGNYSNNLSCNYTIIGTLSNSVAITFQALDTEPCCDWVQIFCSDGSFQSLQFKGNIVPPALMVASCRNVIVWFRTDTSEVRTGFSLQYASCGNTNFNGPSGTISSPNYPQVYTSFLNCNYSISVPDTVTGYVSLTFTDFSTELNFDWVKIICGSGNSYESGTYSGNTTPPQLSISSCRNILVWFRSDVSSVYRGFSLSYQFISYCGNLVFSGQSGTISSPSNRYNYLDCSYTINVSNPQYTVVLTFQRVAIQRNVDFVQISCLNGQTFSSPYYSGNELPPVLTIQSCNRVTVRFTTGLSSVYSSFSLYYEVRTSSIPRGFSTKPLNVFTSFYSAAPVILNCTSNTGYLPSWSFNRDGYTNITLTTSSCVVSSYSAYSSWLQTESLGPGSCNLIISATASQLLNLRGVLICTDSTLTSTTAVFIPYRLSINTTLVNGSQTLPSADLVRGDQLNLSCALDVYSYASYPGIYHLIYWTLFYNFSVLETYWSSGNGDIIPSSSTSKTSSFIIVTAPAETLPSYTCKFNMNLTSTITNTSTNFPAVLSNSTNMFQVLYWPVEEKITTTGDTNGEIPINGTLTCNVPANPPATYVWLDESNGNTINSTGIVVSHSGNYTCIASNLIRGKVYRASKSITVQTKAPSEDLNILAIIIGASVGGGVLVIILLIVSVSLCVRAYRKKIKINKFENGDHTQNTADNSYVMTNTQRGNNEAYDNVISNNDSFDNVTENNGTSNNVTENNGISNNNTENNGTYYNVTVENNDSYEVLNTKGKRPLPDTPNTYESLVRSN